MTVPALGCPEVLRWDLTRHGLSSLPYSPDTGGRVGKDATRGGEIIGCGFSLFIQTSVKPSIGFPLSNKQSTLLYSTAQTVDWICVFKSSLE